MERQAWRLILSVLLLFFLLAGLAACLPLATPAPFDTPTPTLALPTDTPTPTVIWFPPTPTNTPYPTPVITPTIEVRPEFGDLIGSDDFTVKGDWEQSSNSTGSVSVGKGELTLAVAKSRGYLSSLRKGNSLRDFYLEITASPSICRGEDEYGLLLRATSSEDFYRFVLTCSGKVRVDRVLGARTASLYPITLSGAVPPGAPSISRLAVNAQGSELSLFVNGQFIVKVRDPSLPGGDIGVFARAAGEDVVTVNFSDLDLYQPTP